MKIAIIGLLIAVSFFVGGVFAQSAFAGFVQDLAGNPKVAAGIYDGNIHRFEWFDDVCYNMEWRQGVAISCVKK